jgi:aminomethyltransferase
MPKTIKTPFYEKHLELGAKMVEFAGFVMPISYSGIIEEHRKVRETAGIFDLSHMGEFFFSGAAAAEAIDKLVTNNVSKLEVGQALYTPMCIETGGIVDDLLVYCIGNVEYMMVVNAANIEKDWKHVSKLLSKAVDSENRSLQTALVAVQGPLAEPIMEDALGVHLNELEYFHHIYTEIAETPVTLSRTGYTGENGFEVYVDADIARPVWDELYELTVEAGGVPVGLGARDTLRMEMKYCLYGNDIDETTTPYEAGIGWTVKLKKPVDFVGKEVLVKQKKDGVKRELVGFVMTDRGVPRHGYDVFDRGDAKAKKIGDVTSGGYGPSVDRNIGIAYVPTEMSEIGTELYVEIRDKRVAAEVCETPFLKLLD